MVVKECAISVHKRNDERVAQKQIAYTALDELTVTENSRALRAFKYPLICYSIEVFSGVLNMDKKRKHIKFIDETHQYFNIETNEEYLSVTKFVSMYYPRFEADEIARKLVTGHRLYQKKYEGLSIHEAIQLLKAEWKARTDIGTNVHNILEKYVLEGISDNKYSNIFDTLRLKERYPNDGIVPEMLLFSDKYKIAGQADLVLVNEEEETFKIFDYKTNQKGIQRNSFQDNRMFAPLEHLPDCNYYHYSIQLSLYAYMLWKETGFKCDGLSILWVDTDELVMREYQVGSHGGDLAEILSERKAKINNLLMV